MSETAPPITGDMTIGDVVRRYPEVVETLLSFGVHCVGCGGAYVETLEQGLRGHGFSKEEVDEAVKLLNEAVKSTPQPTADTPLVITDKAVEKIKEFLSKENKPGFGLRVEVIPGGCSGFQYSLTLDEASTNDDKIIEVNGVKVFVDTQSMDFLKGAKIDYLDTLQGAGFKISNPNATRSCGCGQSFS